MSILNLNRGPLMYPDVGTGGTGADAPAAPMAGNDTAAGPAGVPEPEVAPTTAAPAPPATVPEPPPPSGDASINMTSEQLRERMDRDRATYLKSLGFESEEELTAMQTAQAERVEAEEKARREQMSREEKLQEDVAKQTQRADDAEAQAEALRWDQHVSEICASLGVKNVKYARFVVESAIEAAGEDGPEFDVTAWLQERIDPEAEEHTSMRAALGMISPVGTVSAPVTTTAAAEGTDPTPPPAGGGDPKDVDAMAMTSAQWNAHLESKGMR